MYPKLQNLWHQLSVSTTANIKECITRNMRCLWFRIFLQDWPWPQLIRAEGKANITIDTCKCANESKDFLIIDPSKKQNHVNDLFKEKNILHPPLIPSSSNLGGTETNLGYVQKSAPDTKAEQLTLSHRLSQQQGHESNLSFCMKILMLIFSNNYFQLPLTAPPSHL